MRDIWLAIEIELMRDWLASFSAFAKFVQNLCSLMAAMAYEPNSTGPVEFGSVATGSVKNVPQLPLNVLFC